MKALEMEHLQAYRGSVRTTCRYGSYTEGIERYAIEGYGNGAFLL